MRRWLILLGSSLLLVILWLPGLRYPILSDTAIYALLGESLWQHGRYKLLEQAYAKHLPLHALLSYPLTTALGFSMGMKIATLIAGIAVLILSFLVLRESFSERVALIAVPLIAVHHGFVLMTMLGSADLLFTALFLVVVLAVLKAEDDPRWYTLAGFGIGLASLTRYNGVPLLAIPVLTIVLWRKEDVRSVWWYLGVLLGVSLFGLWLWRNFRVFGDPFHTAYTVELSAEVPNALSQVWENFLYYLDPMHNILPILFVAALYGIYREGRRHPVLLLSMLSVLVLTAIWWVQAIRFAFPAYPLLIGFSVVGLLHVLKRFPHHRLSFLSVLVGGIIATHVGALCLYSYGGCNSLFDRAFGIIPRNLGLSSEGFYTWRMARDAFDRIAPTHAVLGITDAINERMQKTGVYRSDVRVIDQLSAECPYYRISQHPQTGEDILYATEDHPVTYVTVQECL